MGGILGFLAGWSTVDSGGHMSSSSGLPYAPFASGCLGIALSICTEVGGTSMLLHASKWSTTLPLLWNEVPFSLSFFCGPRLLSLVVRVPGDWVCIDWAKK